MDFSRVSLKEKEKNETQTLLCLISLLSLKMFLVVNCSPPRIKTIQQK